MPASEKGQRRANSQNKPKGSDSGRLSNYFLRGKESESEESQAKSNMAQSQNSTMVTDSPSNVTNEELKVLMTTLIQSLEAKISERLQAVDKSIKTVCEEVAGVKETIELQEVRITALEKTPMGHIENMMSRIEALESQLEYNEYRSRKYNVLIYGVGQTKDENIDKVVGKFLARDLRIEEEDLNEMIICNYHRIPKREEGPGPDAIIIKFGRMKDRNLVLNHRINLPKGKSVRTDLPNRLKKKRAELAKCAYGLRRDNKLQTAIRESKTDVWIETRKDRSERWQKYNALGFS